jgi:nucleoside-diphosphate-sugar epimerase
MRALVTGATGFLGGRLARRLKELGHPVTAFGRHAGKGAALERDGIRFVAGDLSDGAAVARAAVGQELVFHCGARSSPWGTYREFHDANVLGTRHVLEAAREGARVIHVSSPSIYVDGGRDRLGISESEPLPKRSVNLYARTKRMAEDLVDEAHRAGRPVITIRPQAIFGPGDTTVFPRIIKVAQRGVFPVIGDERNIVDITYVDNVVDALVLCASSPRSTLGRKYNITNGEPRESYPLIDEVLSRLGIRYRKRHIPFALAYAISAALEAAHRVVPGEPLLTRYSVSVLACSRTLDISAARADLGYNPRIPLEEGLSNFVAWWKENDG